MIQILEAFDQCPTGWAPVTWAAVSSRNRNISFFPIVLNPKKRGAVYSLSPFFLCFVTDQTLEVLFSVCFLFKKIERISFVPATELLDSLTHLTSIYGVFTVYKLL